jgi:hypothetical protein
LELDEGGPSSSPDVLVTVAGRRWAFECKTLQTPAQQPRGLTLKDRLEDAVCQINNSQTAEVGISIINAKNLIAHERVWAAPGDSAFYEGALNVMEDVPLRMVANMEKELGKEGLCHLFRDGKSLPGLIFFLQSTTLLHPSQFLSPVTARLNNLLPRFFCDFKLASGDEAVLQRLNDAVMTGF